GGVCAIVVERGDALAEQTVMNHHGITVWADAAQIDALRTAAQSARDRYGIRAIKRAVDQHGSYSFYMQDRDTNWWEIEVGDGHADPGAPPGAGRGRPPRVSNGTAPPSPNR